MQRKKVDLLPYVYFFIEALHRFCRLVFLVSENTSSDLRMVITRLAHSHESQVKPILSKPLIILFGQENHKTINNKLNDKKKQGPYLP